MTRSVKIYIDANKQKLRKAQEKEAKRIFSIFVLPSCQCAFITDR